MTGASNRKPIQYPDADKPERAVLFNRVSTSSQYDKKKFEATRRQAEEYCNGGNRQDKFYRLEKEQFIHVGSAFKEDIREGEVMQRIIGNMEDGTWDKPCHLVIANADRLDRQDALESVSNLSYLCKLGFVLHDLHSGTVLDKRDHDQMGALIYFVVCLQRAYDESLSKSVRMKTIHQRKRQKAIEAVNAQNPIFMGRTFPKWLTGWDRKKEQWKIDDGEVFKIKYVFSKLADGWTASGLVRELNELARDDKRYAFTVYSKGRKRKAMRNTLWTVGTLKRLYGNDAVLGRFYFCKTVDGKRTKMVDDETGKFLMLPDYYPRIVDDETFTKVQQLVAGRVLTGRVPYRPSVFTHLAKCGYCRNLDGNLVSTARRESKMVRGDPYYSFACISNGKLPGHCTSGLSYEADLQAVFLRYLKEVDLAALLRPESGGRAQDLKRRIAKEKTDLLDKEIHARNLAEMVKMGTKTKAIIDLINATDLEQREIEERLKSNTAELAQLTSEGMGKFNQGEISRFAESMEVDEEIAIKLNAQLKFIISSVELYPLGLPRKLCLSLAEKSYGKKANRSKLYGKAFPAFSINFRNGARKTIVYQKKNLDNVICIYREGEEYFVERTWGSMKMSSRAIGGTKVASEQTGVEFIDGIADGVGAEGLMVIDVDHEFNKRALDQAVKSTLHNWSRGLVHEPPTN